MTMEFKTVAALDELEEDEGKCVLVEGRQVALFRVGDAVHAIDNLCPHQGGPLADGWVNNGQVICPLHGWEFSLETGTTTMGEPVPVHKVRIDGNNVQVAIQA